MVLPNRVGRWAERNLLRNLSAIILLQRHWFDYDYQRDSRLYGRRNSDIERDERDRHGVIDGRDYVFYQFRCRNAKRDNDIIKWRFHQVYVCC